jgi:glycosyltransferase involved in cell wall biosynthesis
MEALSLGVPVVCHDACGMGVAVDGRCGIKVPLRDPATSVRGFADALAQLAAQPALLRALSKGALDRARELDWDSNVEAIAAVYARIAAVAAGGWR